MGEIERQARLIAALADTISNRNWASDILTKCQQMKDAVSEIERLASERQAGER